MEVILLFFVFINFYIKLVKMLNNNNVKKTLYKTLYLR